VLLTGGLAASLFGLTWWVVDVEGLRAWTAPFVTYGRNAIAVYVGSEVLAGTLQAIHWAGADGVVLSVYERVHRTLFATWLSPPNASLGFALATVLLWYLVAWWMDRRGIYLKV
jgi:predicted acyltransferase